MSGEGAGPTRSQFWFGMMLCTGLRQTPENDNGGQPFSCDAIDACDPLARKIVRDLVKNIVLVGGNTVPAGVTDLFVARFSEHAPHHALKVEITIPPAAERGSAAWRGATAVASLLVNQADGWLDRQMVDELGAHAAVEAHARSNLWAPWGNRAL